MWTINFNDDIVWRRLVFNVQTFCISFPLLYNVPSLRKIYHTFDHIDEILSCNFLYKLHTMTMIHDSKIDRKSPDRFSPHSHSFSKKNTSNLHPHQTKTNRKFTWIHKTAIIGARNLRFPAISTKLIHFGTFPLLRFFFSSEIFEIQLNL